MLPKKKQENKNAGLKCSQNCCCGTKKACCQNKNEMIVEFDRNPSAFARHQEAVANAEEEIKVLYLWCFILCMFTSSRLNNIFSISRFWYTIYFLFQNFITNLTVAKKDTLLVRLLTQGRGSLDFARNMLDESESNNTKIPIAPICPLVRVWGLSSNEFW